MIKNVKVAHAFEMISADENYQDTLANAVSLICHVVDASERVAPTKKKRIECNFSIDSLEKGYHVVVEEIEE